MFLNSTVNPNDSAECHMARAIFNPYFRRFLMVECAVAPLIIGPNLLFLHASRQLTIFPTSLRLILSYLSVIFLLFSITTLIRNLYFLLSPVCSFTFTKLNCKLFDIITGYTVIPQFYFALFSLCVERVYATLNYRNYDRNEKSWLGWVLIISSQIFILIAFGWDTFSMPTDEYVPICYISFMPALNQALPIYFTLEGITIIMTIFIYFYNYHLSKRMFINRALFDLSSRFLVDQNVQVNSIVLPTILLHLITMFPLICILLPMVSLGFSQITVQLIYRSATLWRILYASVDPLLAFYINSHLRRILFEGPFGNMMRRLGWSGRRNGAIERDLSPTTAHFDLLQKSWNVPTNRQKQVQKRSVWMTNTAKTEQQSKIQTISESAL